ncbi:MAG: FAD-dependent monooxygenase [Burkholderiales bacterium]|nr:FAD-dependent monooxygenase [Burkholderiales bacterium]
MEKQILIAGGGIGGLAAALACSRAGWSATLMERTREFGEVGAGIQMGPNVVRRLHAWGLEDDLKKVAAYPEMLRVRSADTGDVLGRLPLGERARKLYGAPYATIHRADLHTLLLKAVEKDGTVQLHLGRWLESFLDIGPAVQVTALDGAQLEGQALVGADGLWSTVRQNLLNDAEPRITGHLAYRALIAQRELPAFLRSSNVTVWMGPDLHVVQYPVRRGHWLNVVAIVKGQVIGDVDDWDQETHTSDLRAAMGRTCNRLQDLVSAINNWRLWALCDRPPMVSAGEQAKGRVALLGDAAHPMRPYMAQGAGMAIEDATCLQAVLSGPERPMAERLQAYANERWRRNARVQARSIRNGQIFHAKGLMRWGRDAAMDVLGTRLLDVPWLYRG